MKVKDYKRQFEIIKSSRKRTEIKNRVEERVLAHQKLTSKYSKYDRNGRYHLFRDTAPRKYFIWDDENHTFEKTLW